jgi:hypothetical protein
MLTCLILAVTPGSALYDFEGIPLKIIATGEVAGDVQAFGQYGLQDPPVTLQFDVAGNVQWARTYVGVWGGTPRYTGWVAVGVNNGTVQKTTLYGKDDRNENVYVTGYGVYWVAYDTTTQVRTGRNSVIATTSRTDPDNKLDGRIYTVVTIVVTRGTGGTSTRYWIAEGNENLHGEGWSGTNPTTHEEASVLFPVPDISGLSSAHLTCLYLASGKGQPDYTLFNSRDLGTVVTDSARYPAGARDIADETSFNAGLGNPLDSRYTDMEVFDVAGLLSQGKNEVIFQRGRDLDGDGEISSVGEKPEGEDYIHPVLSMLVLQKPRGGASGPDLVAGPITITGAYEGETAGIRASLQNLGSIPLSPATVIFRVDGSEVARKEMVMEKSGIQEVSGDWKATPGHHTVQVEVSVAGDTDRSNNVAIQEITVGTLPDLAVSIQPPVPAGESPQEQESPISTGFMVGAVVAAGVLIGRRRRPPMQVSGAPGTLVPLALIFLLITAGVPLLPSPVAAAGAPHSYQLPIVIHNLGGSDAAAFTVTVYLDGEKVAIKSVDDGLAAGKEIRGEIPLHTSPGSHAVKVVIDEEGRICDASRANNSAESIHVFP